MTGVNPTREPSDPTTARREPDPGTVGYTWVTHTHTLDAIDPAVRALEDTDGWRLIGVGIGSGGQTTLTFGWPWPYEGTG